MNVTLRETRIDSPGRQYMGFVDCDVHPFFRTPADFDPFLSQRWREHRVSIGNRSRQPLHKGSLYPRMSPGNGMRMDAWPKDGGPPGSDAGGGGGMGGQDAADAAAASAAASGGGANAANPVDTGLDTGAADAAAEARAQSVADSGSTAR